MLKKYIKTESGFTLVELLIYLALMGIFLMVLLDIFVTSLNTKLSSERDSVLSGDAAYVLSKLSYEIANADSIELPASGSSGTTLRITTDSGVNTFASVSGKLVLTDNLGTSMGLNGNDTELTAINFQNISAAGGKPTIKFTLTFKSLITVNNENEEKSISSTISTR